MRQLFHSFINIYKQPNGILIVVSGPMSSTGNMSGGPSGLDNRSAPMGGSHAMHGSTGNPAVSQGHSVGHPGTRGGGYNTGPVPTSSATGYGPLGSNDQVKCLV